MVYTNEEIKKFVDMHSGMMNRCEKIAKMFTSFYGYGDYVVGLSISDSYVKVITKDYDQDNYDCFEFETRYLFMSDAELKAERERLDREIEKRIEENERIEYEKLKKKFEPTE